MDTDDILPIILFILLLIIGYIFFGSGGVISNNRHSPYNFQMLVVEDNSVVLPKIPPYPELPPIFAHIINAESGGNPLAKNPHSTARGLLQITKGSEMFCEKILGRDIDVYNVRDNLECGKVLHRYFGLSPWLASRKKWISYSGK